MIFAKTSPKKMKFPFMIKEKKQMIVFIGIQASGKTTFYKSSITDSEYKLTLSEDRIGRKVYCVITDAFGNSIQTETVTLYAAE